MTSPTPAPPQIPRILGRERLVSRPYGWHRRTTGLFSWMKMIPCTAFGMTTNASTPTFGKWDGSSSQHSRAIIPNGLTCTYAALTPPNKISLPFCENFFPFECRLYQIKNDNINDNQNCRQN